MSQTSHIHNGIFEFLQLLPVHPIPITVNGTNCPASWSVKAQELSLFSPLSLHTQSNSNHYDSKTVSKCTLYSIIVITIVVQAIIVICLDYYENQQTVDHIIHPAAKVKSKSNYTLKLVFSLLLLLFIHSFVFDSEIPWTAVNRLPCPPPSPEFMQTHVQ